MPDLYASQHPGHLSDSIVAAFSEVEKTMALDLAAKLKQALKQAWKDTLTSDSINTVKVIDRKPFKKLTGTKGFKKQLHYPDWFFMAVWLGPGHPLLESIRKDMSDLWGVEFPTAALMYPKFIPVEAQMELFYGNPAKPATPKEASVEERAKAIKKTINDSTVNGLSAAIKGHLPDDLDGLGNSTRVHELEASHASMARELEEAKKKVVNLEVKLGESRALQAKTKNDMETLREDIRQLKAAQTDIVKKEVEAIRATLTGMEAKVLKGEKDMNTLQSEVAQSAEKAEKAVETGALVLSFMSTSGGQKRKRDEIS